MNLLIEHNAFQCIGKCLDGKAQNNDDIDDFLQICIQQIFCDQLQLSNFVPDYVKNNSTQIIDKVSSYGFDNISVLNDRTTYLYDEVCNKVSEELLNIINWTLDSSKTAQNPLQYLPHLSNDILAVVTNITNAIKENNINLLKGELLDISLKDKLDGAFVDIITRNEELLFHIMKFQKQNGWNENLTLKLISDSRVLQNSITAQSKHLLYSASIKRAKEEAFINQRIYQAISQIIEKSNELQINQGPAIKLPSMREYLINKSKGNPQRLLDETIRLRELFNPVREYINNNGNKLSFNTGQYDEIAMESLIEISNDLYASACKKNSTTSSTVVIETDNIFTAPITDLSKVKDAVLSRTIKPQLRCFTEMSRLMRNSERQNKYEDIFRYNCSHR
ncbi:hypothetical protein [Coprobacter sp.]